MALIKMGWDKKRRFLAELSASGTASYSALSGTATYATTAPNAGTSLYSGSAGTVLYSGSAGIVNDLTAPPAIGGTTANTIRSLFDHDVALSGTLTVNQCSGGVITNYGQTAADTTILVPTAFSGGSFIVFISTAQAANDYIVDLETGGDIMYLDGVALGAGKGVYVAAPAVGNCIQFIAQQTGTTTYQWFAYTISGPWLGQS
jgi:hypothetical protein